MDRVVIFGGTGFVGTHLTQHLLNQGLAQRIFLVDFNPPRNDAYSQQLQAGLRSHRVVYVEHDVRNAIAADLLPGHADLVVNLAAVHREPGHLSQEYFETNLLGAENVCAWASAADCPTMVFTSSISPYGPSEEEKSEASLPTPQSAYGSSKLAAEKIHLAWQLARPGRQLLLIRPGVVFGPGEGGNVTRLVRSLMKGYFVYLGNRTTIKSGGYVKELCLVIMFGLEQLRATGEPSLLLNFTMDPPPTMEQMVDTILKVGGKQRKPFSLPRNLLLALSYPLAGLERLLGVQFPINRTRLRKLFRSNNVVAAGLGSLNYPYAYTLESAFRDWKLEMPEDFSAAARPEVMPSEPAGGPQEDPLRTLLRRAKP